MAAELLCEELCAPFADITWKRFSVNTRTVTLLPRVDGLKVRTKDQDVDPLAVVFSIPWTIGWDWNAYFTNYFTMLAWETMGASGYAPHVLRVYGLKAFAFPDNVLLEADYFRARPASSTMMLDCFSRENDSTYDQLLHSGLSPADVNVYLNTHGTRLLKDGHCTATSVDLLSFDPCCGAVLPSLITENPKGLDWIKYNPNYEDAGKCWMGAVFINMGFSHNILCTREAVVCTEKDRGRKKVKVVTVDDDDDVSAGAGAGAGTGVGVSGVDDDGGVEDDGGDVVRPQATIEVVTSGDVPNKLFTQQCSCAGVRSYTAGPIRTLAELLVHAVWEETQPPLAPRRRAAADDTSPSYLVLVKQVLFQVLYTNHVLARHIRHNNLLPEAVVLSNWKSYATPRTGVYKESSYVAYYMNDVRKPQWYAFSTPVRAVLTGYEHASLVAGIERPVPDASNGHAAFTAVNSPDSDARRDDVNRLLNGCLLIVDSAYKESKSKRVRDGGVTNFIAQLKAQCASRQPLRHCFSEFELGPDEEAPKEDDVDYYCGVSYVGCEPLPSSYPRCGPKGIGLPFWYLKAAAAAISHF